MEKKELQGKNKKFGKKVIDFIKYFFNSKQILFVALLLIIGGLLISVLPFTDIMEVVESISLTVTLGMLLYILILELLPKVINNKDKKETISGIILGVILLLITLFI